MELEQVLNVAFQIAVIAIVLLLPLFIQIYRKNVQNKTTDTRLAAIVRLANQAIDYVEDLDRRGQLEPALRRLQLPEEVIQASKGVQKLSIAGHWLEGELKQAGIEITDEKAKEWIAGEFRQRVGDVRMGATVAKQIRESVRIIQGMDQQGLIELAPATGRFTQLAGLAADWVVAQLDEEGVSVEREEILTRVRAEFLKSQQAQVNEADLSPSERLEVLARQAVTFLESRKPGSQLDSLPTVQLAAAWVLTEVLRQGLDVSRDQISEALNQALAEHNIAPTSPQPAMLS